MSDRRRLRGREQEGDARVRGRRQAPSVNPHFASRGIRHCRALVTSPTSLPCHGTLRVRSLARGLLQPSLPVATLVGGRQQRNHHGKAIFNVRRTPRGRYGRQTSVGGRAPRARGTVHVDQRGSLSSDLRNVDRRRDVYIGRIVEGKSRGTRAPGILEARSRV